MKKIKSLRSAENLSDLAWLIGVEPSKLAYVIYRLPVNQRYTEFEISKSGGGKRKISVPKPALKAIQRRLANFFQDCLGEFEETSKHRSNISHGFVRNRSIISNALPHKRARYVFNIDIKNFFGSINFGRVRGFF